MTTKRPVVLAALLIGIPASATSAAEATWRRYTNSRFGVSVEYPANLIADGPATDLNDGRPGAATRPATGVSFSSADGTEISIYGLEAARSPYEEMCKVGCEGETYAVKRPKMAVVSGRRGNLIYYRRCLSAPESRVLRCFNLEYPSVRKDEMQAVIYRMSRTLR